MLLFLRRLERLRLAKLRASEAHEHAVYKHVFVLDLSGIALGLFRRENRDLMSRAAERLQAAYPESLETALIVNPPQVRSHMLPSGHPCHFSVAIPCSPMLSHALPCIPMLSHPPCSSIASHNLP